MTGNQKGFSIVEIMVTLGIITIVVLGNTMFINDFVKRMYQYQRENDDESQMAVLSVAAMNILKKSSLSFNRLSMADDAGQNFFDYYPDMPQRSFGATGTRSVLLSASTPNKNFYLLSTEEGDFNSLNYDPMFSYKETSTPTDIRNDGTITYVGLNTVPDLTDENGIQATKKLMTSYFAERWANGKLFVLTCPTYLRPVLSNNTVNLMTPPRSASFVGKVSNDDLLPLFDGEAAVKILNYHPVTQASYVNLDQYFRTLPVVGGAAPFVKIEPAVLIRFELRANKNYPAGFADLYLRRWTPAGYDEGYSVAEKIQSIEFKRKSITLPLISMEIKK